MKKIIQLDKELLVFLNGLGSERWDGMWLMITKQFYWTPFFVYVLFYLLLKHVGFKIRYWKYLLFVIFLPLGILYSILFYKPQIDKNFIKKVKHLFVFILFIAVLIIFTDQTANLFKTTFERLRPCNDEEIKSIIRIVKSSNSFSFFSGHASNSMATMMFFYLNIRNNYKHSYLLFLFPLIFAYSRIYLGLHFPLDILTGYIFGATFGIICFRFYKKYVLKN